MTAASAGAGAGASSTPNRVGGGLPPFPGGIGVTHLRVYDSEAPDGLRGGTPHLHSCCTEAYYVIAGHGAVQTLTLTGGYEETSLEPGRLVWFTPGTIHRLVNHDRALEILVLMANAGLPEAGDMVITFAPDVLDDTDRYHDLAVLPPGEQTTAETAAAARCRRDAGVEGYLPLRDALVAGDDGPLRAFHRQAAALLAPRAAGWRAVWAGGPRQALDQTRRLLDAVEAADGSLLADAEVHELGPASDQRRLGCCGALGTYVPPTGE